MRMTGLADITAEIPDASHCRSLVDAWLDWRGRNLLPMKDDVHPEDLRAALAAMAVVAVEDRDTVTVRVSSSEVAAQTGINRRGADLLEAIREEDREERKRRIWNMVTTPCGAIMEVRVVKKSGATGILRSVALPVGEQPGERPTLLYVASDFSEPHDGHPAAQIVDLPLAHAFRYVDIGAGVP